MTGRHVCLLGATGTIGAATLLALRRRGHRVTCLLRAGPGRAASATTRLVDFADPGTLGLDGFDAVVSCMASRTGAPEDARAVDHLAHLHVLRAAQAAGVGQFVLLSALCVQRPLLAFQREKLAFEAALAASGLSYAIVRPTAFFKSLSGQVDRVRRGKPFLVFGDGRLTACKPISDPDLADYLVDCLDDPSRHGRILPIGGPGPALTPLDQAEMLFHLLGRAPRIRHVPLALLDGIVATLGLGGRLAPSLRRKAELARIGRYYASESMLVLDPATGRYDADATPSTGTQTLADHYAAVLATGRAPDRGDHSVF